MDHLSKGTRPASDKARLEPGQAPSTARASFTNPTFWVHDHRTEKQERQAHLQGSKPFYEVHFMKNPVLELSPLPRPGCHTFPQQRQDWGPPMNMHQPDLSPLKKALGLKCLPPSRTDENPKQHVPLEEFVANLRSMVRYLRSVDVPEGRLILITPPPLCEAAWAQECLQQGECGLPDAGLRPQGSTPCLRFPSTEVTEEVPSCLLLTESV